MREPDQEQLRQAVHAALRAWHQPAPAPAPVLENLACVQEQQAALPPNGSGPGSWPGIRSVLLAAHKALAQQDPHEAEILKRRFLDRQPTDTVASSLNLSADTVNRQQARAIIHLTEIVATHEQAALARRAQRLEAALPPRQYARLFGLEGALARLREVVLSPGAPTLVAVVGIGGIGKTAVADALARQMLAEPRFTRVIWLRAPANAAGGGSPGAVYEQLLLALADAFWPEAPPGTASSAFARLREVLKARPHLVVIDNLESPEETAYLLGQLPGLADPTKFLLTARSRPVGQVGVFAHTLDELPPAEAFALLRDLAASAGQGDLGQATDEDLQPIYATVGGNPLALRLVAGLAAIQPLPRILADLGRSRPGQIEDLYRHIYWQAWRQLSPPGRAVLQAMPLAGEPGALPEQMQAMSRLGEVDFWPAVNELVARSLLEVRGTLLVKRYGIHRLTDSFLRTEIIDWPDDVD